MARMTEHRLQALFGHRTRLNEVDPRVVTRDFGTPAWFVKFPVRAARTLAYELRYEFWRHSSGRTAHVDRPVLMYGMPHSGTTISMRLAATHPDLANLSEANSILQPHGYFDYANGDYVRTAADATPAEVERLQHRFAFQAWLQNRPRVLNKSPNNTVRLEFLRAVFPDAFFVHVIRDGRAVVHSLVWGHARPGEPQDRFKPWREREDPFPGVKPPRWRELLRDNPLEQHALQWREALTYALAEEERLKLPVLHLRYETLCQDPRGTLTRLFEFAQLRVTPRIVARLPARLDNRNDKWRTRLSAADVAVITRIEEPMLHRLGYAL
jgi:hypothetical protein